MTLEDFIDQKIIIYGSGKYQRDFEFVFDMLAIAQRTGDAGELKAFLGENLDSFRVIVCDFDKAGAERVLNQLGLVYEKHWFFGEDLFHLLDYDLVADSKGRKLAIWATGVDCDYFIDKEKDIQKHIHCFIDTNPEKSMETKCGKQIIHPDSVSNWDEYFIVVATVRYYEEIHEFLASKGLIENKDYISYRKAIRGDEVAPSAMADTPTMKPSAMMRKTLFDKPRDLPFCKSAFDIDEVFVQMEGCVNSCCQVIVSLGSLAYSSPEEILNSARMRIFRLSLLNRTYSFCDLVSCHVISTRQSKGADFSGYAHKAGKVVKFAPKYLTFNFDDGCNLACTMCRKVKMPSGTASARSVIPTALRRLKNCGWLDDTNICKSISNNGEAFFCKSYDSLIFGEFSGKHKNIRLLSNGTLFNESVMSKLKDKYENIAVAISVDAASKEIYQKIRGGDWDALHSNLQVISRERLKGFVTSFCISMVVQTDNVHELGSFVRLGKELRVDSVLFTHVHFMNNGMTNEELRSMRVLTSDEMPTQELLSSFKDPIIGDPIVTLTGKFRKCYEEFMARG